MSKFRNFEVDLPSTKSVLGFLFMPQFRLSMPAFEHIGPIFISTIAVMFVQAGLLRPNHPATMYGRAKNVPKFKFSDLIGEAWYNLRTGDGATPYQYGIFFGVIMMICLSIISAFVFMMNLFMSTAQAQLFNHPSETVDSSSLGYQEQQGAIFQTSSGIEDVALDVLNKVLRQAAYDTGAPLSRALGGLMGVYNTALLVIASIIVFWAIISIVVDTARTGQIGGGRHNMVWVPIRFVFALALMIPLGSGFNAGQLITLKIAEWGSNLGSNGWVAYVDSLNSSTLIINRSPARATELAVELARIETCRLTYNGLHSQGPSSDLTRHRIQYVKNAGAANMASTFGPAGYLVSRGWRSAMNPTDQIQPYSGWVNNMKQLKVYVGNNSVIDYCGIVTLKNANWNHPENRSDEIINSRVARQLKEAHTAAFFEHIPDAARKTGCGLAHEFNNIRDPLCDDEGVDREYGNEIMPTGEKLNAAAVAYHSHMTDAMAAATTELEEYISSEAFMGRLREEGWGAMGTWYYKIQNLNAVFDSALAPTVSISQGSLKAHNTRGMVMGLFRDRDSDAVLTSTAETIEKFDSWWTAVSVSAGHETMLGQLAHSTPSSEGHDITPTGGNNIMNNLIENIFPMDASRGSFVEFSANEGKYPMTTLIAYGNAFIGISLTGYAAITALATAAGAAKGIPIIGAAGGGAILAALDSPLGSLLATILSLMLVAGMVLKYYVPLIPWIRVTFALLSWIVSVFEAVVIVPLLAMANLSTEGEGLFTQTGRNLWVSSLNILLRPILTVIGFVAALLIFNAMVGYVNSTFNDAINNVTGFGIYILLNIFVNTLIYVFVIFTLANATFKTVDLLPNAVMRWMGGPQDNDFQDSSIEGFIMAAGQHSSRMAGNMEGRLGEANRERKANKSPTDDASSAK